MLDESRAIKIQNTSKKLKMLPIRLLKISSNVGTDSQRHDESYSIISRKKSQDIFSKKNSKCLQFDSNSKIGKIIQELYPKIQSALCQKQLARLNGDWDMDNRIDAYTSEQKLENKMSLRAAQKYLDQRVKSRTIERSRRISSELSPSYLTMYEQMKKELQKTLQNEEDTLIYEPPQISPEGINYYSELKNRPAILQFTKRKIQSKQKQKGLNKNYMNIVSLPILSILNSRKRKNINRKQQQNLANKIKKDSYDRSITNIQQISKRMKRIYSRRFDVKLTDREIQDIQNSTIKKEQCMILDDLGDGEEKICKFNRLRLINQFNQILGDYGRTSSRVKQIRSKTELLRIKSESMLGNRQVKPNKIKQKRLVSAQKIKMQKV